EWLTASRAMEEHITALHGASRGTAFVSHHKVILELTSLHECDIIHEYDIMQRELAVQNPTHDLTDLDMNALTLVATQAAARIFLVALHIVHPPLLSPLKCATPSNYSSGVS
ncbi:hypothetical protein CY34DRAFT_102623, partial [Suillus luteus UH-Slu-Lm8-n1]